MVGGTSRSRYCLLSPPFPLPRLATQYQYMVTDWGGSLASPLPAIAMSPEPMRQNSLLDAPARYPHSPGAAPVGGAQSFPMDSPRELSRIAMIWAGSLLPHACGIGCPRAPSCAYLLEVIQLLVGDVVLHVIGRAVAVIGTTHSSPHAGGRNGRSPAVGGRLGPFFL